MMTKLTYGKAQRRTAAEMFNKSYQEGWDYISSTNCSMARGIIIKFINANKDKYDIAKRRNIKRLTDFLKESGYKFNFSLAEPNEKEESEFGEFLKKIVSFTKNPELCLDDAYAESFISDYCGRTGLKLEDFKPKVKVVKEKSVSLPKLSDEDKAKKAAAVKAACEEAREEEDEDDNDELESLEVPEKK